MSPTGSRVHVIIRGQVQGVYFRESTRALAERLRLSGWVRNLEDGRVEATFEGPNAAVERALDWCHHGPPDARVTGVDALSEEPTGEVGFRVRATHDAREPR